MIYSTAFWASLASLATGAAALWTNPWRGVNRALLSASVHLAVWLASVHLLIASGYSAGWVRVAALLMAWLPAQGCLIRAEILVPEAGWNERVRRARGWLLFAVVLSVWAASPWLVPYSVNQIKGITTTQVAFLAVCGAGCIVFGFQSVADLQARRGVRRVEAQVLLVGVGAGALLVILLCAAAGLLGAAALLEVMPLVAVGCHAGTVWALTSTQLHDARHLLASVAERIVLLSLVVVFVWAVQQLALQFVHEATAYVVAIGLGLWAAAEIHPWLRAMFRRRSRSSRLRWRAYDVAKKDLRPEALEDAFLQVIKDGCQTDLVAILMSSQSRLAGCGLEFAVDEPAMKTLHSMRWVTPERLERERFREDREALRALMAQHGFGLMIANAGPSIAFVLAIGVPFTGQPFTTPDVLRLIDVAATMENSLSRARYLRQAQQSEQLATVGLLGASIAHEIRNPLVSIKTFVHLLPDHYQETAFREKFFRLIGDEVGRIDRLTEQLLDLASPRVFVSRVVDIHSVLKACLDLVAAKAEDKGVRLISDFQATRPAVLSDPNAVKQVVLNLCFNAIQAVEQGKSERWVRITTSQEAEYVEVVVEDSGPGISPEVWKRLFQPFQSTKSSGFGLGLAICKDILSSLHASISADPPSPGRGATFRINFPCPPPTS